MILDNLKINDGKIKCNIREGIKFLEYIGLYEESVKKNCETLEYINKYSEKYRNSVYNEKYEEIYKVAMSNGDYDILLKDGAFFQFNYKKESRNNVKIKYNFYPNPYIDAKENYDSFINKIYGANYEEVGEEYRHLYEQYIAESSINYDITPMRYDFDIEQYLEMAHPISHLHIGREKEVRLPVNYIILPEMFIQIVIMLIYPEIWKEKIKDEEMKNKCFNVKTRTIEICNNMLTDLEKKIVYIN